MEFTKATKSMTRLKIAISGAAGSGKTFSALKIATGIGGKIAVIDTERGSASLYADIFSFDALNIEPPYSPDKYVEAIATAERAGYSVIIIDSLSHAWSGSGGLLDLHDSILKSSKNSNGFSAWRDVTPIQNRLIDTIVGSKCHVIATMRAKQEYVIEQGNGRTQVKRVGTGPQQRHDIEFEFTTYIEISQDHVAVANKDRTGLFDSKFFVPTELTGKTLVEWLNKPGYPIPNAAIKPAEPEPPANVKETPATKLIRTSVATTLREISAALHPELRELFGRYRYKTAQILELWRKHSGHQQNIIEEINSSERKVA